MHKLFILTLLTSSFCYNSFSQNVYKWYKKGKTDKVHKYIEKGGDISVTTLHYFYQTGDEIIDTFDLISAASTYNDITTLKYLIENKHSFKNYQLSIDKALAHATDECNTEIAKLLIKEGADIQRLCTPCNSRNIMLISIGSNCPELTALYDSLNVPYEPNDINNWTALHLAVALDNIESVKNIVNKGLDLNAKSKDGETPIAMACANGNIKIVKYLIDEGADLTIRDNFDNSLLWYAEGNTEIIKLLKANGLQ